MIRPLQMLTVSGRQMAAATAMALAAAVLAAAAVLVTPALAAPSHDEAAAAVPAATAGVKPWRAEESDLSRVVLPEEAAMLLVGTALIGAAAVVRRAA